LNSLYVVYQPIIDLKDGCIMGYEALLRGRLPTNIIIEDALRKGYIKELDAYIHQFALEQFREFLPSYKLFLNAHPDSLPNLLNRHKNIIIEITEDTPTDLTKTIIAAQKLKQLGVSIAFDDFGVGSHTLDTFHQIQPDYLKVDQSLIKQLDQNLDICKELMILCKQSQTIIIAEGIEDQKTLDQCRELGFDYGQGWHIGIPRKLPMNEEQSTKRMVK
jgi:EAL domain-containing protein (putative c-di-GMP-specific phosphodiesterase class I)